MMFPMHTTDATDQDAASGVVSSLTASRRARLVDDVRATFDVGAALAERLVDDLESGRTIEYDGGSYSLEGDTLVTRYGEAFVRYDFGDIDPAEIANRPPLTGRAKQIFDSIEITTNAERASR